MFKKFNKEYFILAGLLTVWLILIGIVGNYFTDIIDNYFNNTLPILLIKLLILLVLLLLFISFLYIKKKRFKFYALSNEVLMKNDSFRAIILPISILNKIVKFSYIDNNNEEGYLNDEDIKNIESLGDVLGLVKQKNIKEIYLDVRNLEKDNGNTKCLIFSKNNEDEAEKNKRFINWLKEIRQIRWNWAVQLLIIAKNSKSLEHIRFICTENKGENKGSIDRIYILKFITICLYKKLGENDGIIVHEIKSFENFTILSELVAEIEEDFENRYNFKDKEIAFDITGGTKPVSVIGTFFTLKSRTPILYVSQDDEFGKVLQINAIINIKPPE